MPRKIPENRLVELVQAATETFIRLGYRRTQMSDIAERLGVAKGTLYLYVESKEALFDLSVRYADHPEELRRPLDLPFTTPGSGATLAYVRQRLLAGQKLPALGAAQARRRVIDVVAEVTEMLRELYEVQADNRRGIKLIDRCSVDYPELAALWFEGAREGVMEILEQYITKRIAGGHMHKVTSVPATARLVLETITFWSVHRHWDPHPQSIEESVAKESVIRFIVAALVKEEQK